MEKELQFMSRKELFTEAKKVAEEQGKVLPFGNTSNQDLIDMIEGRKEFAEKADVRKEIKNRRPLGSRRAKLSIDGYQLPPDKVARWINDRPGRIQDALDGGYEFVDAPNAVVGEEPLSGRDKLSNRISRNVGPDEQGNPMKAYYMIIDKDLYEQDQREKQSYVDETDAAIKGGNIDGKSSDGRYDAGIKIESNM